MLVETRENDQARGIAKRQGFDQHGIDHAEYTSRASDCEGENCDAECHHKWAACVDAQTVRDVLAQLMCELDWDRPCEVARWH